jgi:hypothetical protein
MINNYFDLVQEIETLRLEVDSKVKRLKVEFVGQLIRDFSISLEYKKLRIDEKIQLIDFFEGNNLYVFFPGNSIRETEQKIVSLNNWYKLCFF